MFGLRTYKVVVITGASAGLGRATAHEFARHGARIGLLARDPEALAQTAGEVRALGGEAMAIPVDVAESDAVERAATQIEAQLGPIDVWVNNAMTTVFGPVDKVSPDEFRRVTEVCYFGYVWGTQAALRRMKARDKGSIIQVGSALAYRAIPLQAPYCAAKHAIRGFTDSLRSELLHEGSRIHLTMVQMPALNTPQFQWCRNKMPRQAQPVPPVFEPEMGARAIEWSARHRRRELLVGGSSWQAVWGNKFFPGLLDHYLARIAWNGQQRELASLPRRDDNLWAPVRGQHAVHGPFGARSRDHSLQLRATQQRKWLLLGAAAVGGLLYEQLAERRDLHE